MVARPRPPPKAKKQQPQKTFNTVDDFQDAADAEENTGGKWRAGDKAKSGRAFLRAIDIYNDGLARFPDSLDLAYNKARLELELSQQPSIVVKLPVTLLQLLQQALVSHRHALRLDAQFPDLLFNTAQVLSALIEELDKTSSFDPQQTQPLDLTNEAFRYLEECSRLQEIKYSLQVDRPPEDTHSDDGGVSLSTDSEQAQSNDVASMADEQSVYIEQPITLDDLIDTKLTFLEILKQSIPFSSPDDLERMHDTFRTLIDSTLPNYIAQMPPDQQIEALARTRLNAASYTADMANAVYSRVDGDYQTYRMKLDIFRTLDLENDFGSICSYADSLSEWAASVIRTMTATQSTAGTRDATAMLWSTLAVAQDNYKTAMGLKSHPELTPERKAEMYRARGNVDLMRYRICQETSKQAPSDDLLRQAPQLIKNALLFYTASVNHFNALGDSSAASRVAMQRAMAAIIADDSEKDKYREEIMSKQELASSVLKDMVEDGCIPDGWSP